MITREIRSLVVNPCQRFMRYRIPEMSHFLQKLHFEMAGVAKIYTFCPFSLQILFEGGLGYREHLSTMRDAIEINTWKFTFLVEIAKF